MIVKKPSTWSGTWRWKFAYIPVRLNNGTWIWWERYRYRRVDTGHMWTEMTRQRHLKEEEDW